MRTPWQKMERAGDRCRSDYDELFGPKNAPKAFMTVAQDGALRSIANQAAEALLQYRSDLGTLANISRDVSAGQVDRKLLHCALLSEDLQETVLALLIEDAGIKELYPLGGHLKNQIFKEMAGRFQNYAPPVPFDLVRAGQGVNYQLLFSINERQLAQRIIEGVQHGLLAPQEIRDIIVNIGPPNAERKVRRWTEKVTSEIRKLLYRVSVEDRREIRLAVGMGEQPDAKECSKRLELGLKFAMTGKQPQAAHSDAIEHAHYASQHPVYKDRFLLHELLGSMAEAIAHKENEDRKTFGDGKAGVERFAQFLKTLDLDDVDLSIICMKVIFHLPLPDAWDKAISDPTFGPRAAAMRLHALRPSHPDDFGKDPEVAILMATWQSFSETLREKAFEEDHARVVMYRYTGEASYLEGMQDMSKLDKAFEEDLGL